jgi:hypothetical protein
LLTSLSLQGAALFPAAEAYLTRLLNSLPSQGATLFPAAEAYLTRLLTSLPSQGAALFPAAAIRSDLGMMFTTARFMGPELLATAGVAGTLTVCVWVWVCVRM